MSYTGTQKWLRIYEFDLEWYFGSASARLGFKGQSYGVSGGGVFDEEASARMHEGHLRVEYRRDVQSETRIKGALAQLDVGVVRTLESACAPRGWAWKCEADRVRVLAWSRREDSNVNLVGLVLEGPRLEAAFVGTRGAASSGLVERLAFLGEQVALSEDVTTSGAARGAVRDGLRAVYDEANWRYLGALAQYATAVKEIRAKKQPFDARGVVVKSPTPTMGAMYRRERRARVERISEMTRDIQRLMGRQGSGR